MEMEIATIDKELVLLLTERCNSHCIICPQLDDNDELSLKKNIIEEIEHINDGITQVCLTGGEPTYNWDELLRTILRIKTQRENMQIVLLTNGRIFKNYKAAEEMKKICPLIYVCIPLYSDAADIHDDITGITGSYWETIEGIMNLERAGILIELRNVITAKNVKRLTKWVGFVFRNMPFVYHVAMMGLEPMGRAKKHIGELWIDMDTQGNYLKAAARDLKRRGMQYSIYNYPLCTVPIEIRQYCKKSISEWKRRYSNKCKECIVYADCGGYFDSAANLFEGIISPLK